MSRRSPLPTVALRHFDSPSTICSGAVTVEGVAGTAAPSTLLPGPSVSNSQVTGNISTGLRGPRVVRICFRRVKRGARGRYEKIGAPVLILEVLESTTLTGVGELLFKHYLHNVLNEELYEHIWRFEEVEPCAAFGMFGGDRLAYDVKLPILSKDMVSREPYGMELFGSEHVEKSRIQEGTEMIFHYDEGSPTILAVTVESVTSIPDGSNADQYPRTVDLVPPAVLSRKRKAAEELRLLTITMDEAYPFFAKRMKERGQREPVSWHHGKGLLGRPAPWSIIWGGAFDSELFADGLPVFPASIMTLKCYEAFSNMDEAFYCFEKGIEKQVSPGFPHYITIKKTNSSTTGEIVEERTERKHIQITVRPYPVSFPPSSYLDEFRRDVFGRNEKTRDCFNFALSENWRETAPNFSFVQQFPKCSKWMTSQGPISYWMDYSVGVLKAMKGKQTADGEANVVYETAKYDTIHAAFADMETHLKLPKSMGI